MLSQCWYIHPLVVDIFPGCFYDHSAFCGMKFVGKIGSSFAGTTLCCRKVEGCVGNPFFKRQSIVSTYPLSLQKLCKSMMNPTRKVLHHERPLISWRQWMAKLPCWYRAYPTGWFQIKIRVEFSRAWYFWVAGSRGDFGGSCPWSHCATELPKKNCWRWCGKREARKTAAAGKGEAQGGSWGMFYS